MPRFPTDQLQPGMVLSTDVKDLSGRMLLTAGTEIDERHLKILRTWGVTGVDVENDDEIDIPTSEIELDALAPEIIEEIENEVERRFAGVDTLHPVMVALVDMVKRDLAKQHISEK